MSTYKHFVMRITQGVRVQLAEGASVLYTCEDKLDLIGPFETGKQASDWGATYCSPGGAGDPRWNCVLLDASAENVLQLKGEPFLWKMPIRAPRMIDVKQGAYGRSHTKDEDATPNDDGVVGD